MDESRLWVPTGPGIADAGFCESLKGLRGGGVGGMLPVGLGGGM
jgi:hypothetical protein